MSLQITISDAVKVAMRAKDSARLTTLRFLQAAIKQREIDDRKALNDTEVMAIIEKQIKQRRESIAAYEKAGRAETAAQESAEIVVLQEFLPQAASEQEVLAVIEAAIEEARASGAHHSRLMFDLMVRCWLAERGDVKESNNRK